MKVLLSWLRELVNVQVAPRELAHLLTMSGSEVASVEEVGAHWVNVRIGQVRGLKPHPAAERLFLVEVNLGSHRATLVTAATNLKAGDRVPVVLAGGSVHPGVTIEAVDFRGVRSGGMLCSGIELGISPDGEGIYVLEKEAPVGEDLRSYLHDAVIDLELTPNRPDCLCVIGVARGIVALTHQSMKYPLPSLTDLGEEIHQKTSVTILDQDLCPRYVARMIEGVKIGPSPHWMRNRLEKVGIRSINNVVDVTNFVMMECGQPLHAFDFELLEEERIVVRRAEEGEEFTTLDGVKRILDSQTLMICDGVKPVAIAGVMGAFMVRYPLVKVKVLYFYFLFFVFCEFLFHKIPCSQFSVGYNNIPLGYL